MHRRLVAFLLLLLAFCLSLSQAQLFYNYEGSEESIELTQLWSEGYWKKVRRVRGKAKNGRCLEPVLFESQTLPMTFIDHPFVCP